MVARVEQVGRVLERRRRSRRRRSCRVSDRSNLRGLAPRAPTVETWTPGRSSAPAGAFCSANITWNSGAWLEAARRADRLDELLERQVLVRVRAERSLRARAREQLGDARLAAEVDAQRQRVDEEADQRLDLASGCGRRPGVPTTTSSWSGQPAERAPSKPASSIMNSVAPCCRLSASSPVAEGGVELERRCCAPA